MNPTPPRQGPPGPLHPAPVEEPRPPGTPCGAPIYDELVRSWRDDRRSVPGQHRDGPDGSVSGLPGEVRRGVPGGNGNGDGDGDEPGRAARPAEGPAAPEGAPCEGAGLQGRAREAALVIRPYGVDLIRFSAG